MHPTAIIAHAFAVGSVTTQHAQPAAAVIQHFTTLKEQLQSNYPAVDLTRVASRPDSAPRRASLAEDLAEAGADQDATLLQAAHALILALATHAPQTATAIGVDLTQVKAAALRLHNIRSTGAGVRVQASEFTHDVEMTDVQTRGLSTTIILTHRIKSREM